MKTKQICLVLLILVGTLFLNGIATPPQCKALQPLPRDGDKSNEIATPLAEARNDGKISIRIWDFPRWLENEKSLDRFSWISRKIKEFEQLHPEVKVELTRLTWQRGYEKLKIAAISGNYPDIAPGTVPLLFIKEDLIEPIDEYLTDEDKKDYFQGALNAFKVKGKIYGWPWYMGGQLLYINKEIFASAGVELPTNGHWTISEFEEKLQKLKKYMADKPANFPLGIYFQKDETANFSFLQAYGGEIITEDGKFAGSNPEFIKGIEWIKHLIDEKLIPADSGGKTANDIWTAFGVNHRIGVAAIGLWGIKALESKFKMNFQVVHFPTENSNQISHSYIGTSGLYVFKNRDKNRVKIAMELAKYLTNAENQKDLVKYTQFPTRAATGNIYASSPHMSEAWGILQEGCSVYPDSRWPQIDEEFEANIQRILLGELPVKEGMEKTGENINRILSLENGSICNDIRESSLFAKSIAIISILAFIFALASRQTHLIMIIPAVTLIGLFLFYPLSDALLLAFRNYKIGEVGGATLENFIRAFQDPKFTKACWNTLIYTLIVVPANTLTALIVAGMIYGLTGKIKSFFRAAYYLPGVASVVVLTMVWRYMFNTELGLFNTVLTTLGFEPVGWLTNPSVAFWSVMISGIIKSPGGAMLIYLAAMGNIPASLYESADLDGAGPIKKWWYITVPLLKSTTTFLLITGTISALQVFAQVMMLTDGGPGISTQVVVYRVYTSAFRDFDFGLSSAMALILFIAIMVITLIQRKLTNQEAEYLA